MFSRCKKKKKKSNGQIVTPSVRRQRARARGIPRDMSSEVPFDLEGNDPQSIQPCKLPPSASFTAPREQHPQEQHPHMVLVTAGALAVPCSYSMPSQRAGATRPRQSRVVPTGSPPESDSSVKRVGAEEAAKKVQASFRGQQCRVKVDIPTVGRRLKQLQADRHGFAGLGLALVVAVAMVAVIFLQSDVGGAHAVELALRHAVRQLPHSTPGLNPNSLPKPWPWP